MKIKKSLWAVLPAAALAFGAVAMALMPKGGDAIEANAIDYSRAKRSLTIENGAVTATFNISNYDIGDLQGWLLCLLSEKPTINAETRKITDSDKRHPYDDAKCAHYFFAKSTKGGDGTVTITWAANSGDQKGAWTADEKTGEENKTLKDYLDAGDWYLAIGPRHYYGTWKTTETIGDGKDHIWENIDYYVGLESSLLKDLTGETYLDLTKSGWDTDNVKFAFYYSNGTDNGWSDFAVAVTGQDSIYLAPYELEFNPTSVVAVRMSKEAAKPSLEDAWNQTKDLDFYRSGVVEVTSLDDESDGNSSPLAIAKVLDEEVLLDNYKHNNSDNPKHYNDEVTLKGGDEFEIKLGDTSYHTFTTHDTVKDAFTLNEDKIHVNTAGTYAFYFDATNHSLYIADPVLAADDWAQSFLGANCDATKDNWETLETSYLALPEKSKTLFREAPHTKPGAELVGFIALAVERYDLLLTKYGTATYGDFMERIDEGTLTLPQSTSNALFLNGDNRSTTILLVLAGVGTATLTGAIVYAKKRKNRA